MSDEVTERLFSEKSSVPNSTGRVDPIDAMRGLAVLLYVSACLLMPVLFTTPSSELEQLLIRQLSPSIWHGITTFDLLQPAFLAVMGSAVVLSFDRRKANDQSHIQILRHSILRSLILFGIGVVVDGWLLLPKTGVRLAGPLQQIAVCYMLAAILIHITNWMTEFAACVLLLVNYGLLLEFFPATDDPLLKYSVENNLYAMVDDAWLPGIKYFGLWDPYGVVSLVPAMAITLAGMVLARAMTNSHLTIHVKLIGLIIIGFALINNGLLLKDVIPVNPYLLTTPFVLIALGATLMALAVCNVISIPRTLRPAAKPLIAMGQHSLVLVLFARLLVTGRGSIESAISELPMIFPDQFAMIIQLTCFGVLAWWLTRRKESLIS